MAHRHEAVGLASYCTIHQVRVSENSPRESGISCKTPKPQIRKIFWHAQAKTCTIRLQLTQFACKPTEMQAVDMHAGTKSRIQNQNPESRIQTPRAGSLDFVRIRGMIPGSEMRRAVFTARQNCKKFSCTSAKLFVPWILLAGLQNHESKSESRIGASLAPRILRGECKTQNIVMGGRWTGTGTGTGTGAGPVPVPAVVVVY